MADLKGFDAEFPPVNPVPSGYQWAGIYTAGVNAARVTLPSEQAALERAGLRLLPYGVYRTQCPGCVTGPMTPEQGTADGQEFVRLAESRGFTGGWLLAFDWEAGTETLAGFVAYATAAAQAVRDAGHLVAHYGTPAILGALMPAQGGNCPMDAIILTHWTNSATDDAVSLWWRQRFPLFAWQYGGANPLDFNVCNQAFFDALGTGMTAGPMQPVNDSETFPTGYTLSLGFYAFWKKWGGLPIFGMPIGPEHDENGITVQYTERSRLERHPGSDPANFDVMLGLVGSELLTAQANVAKPLDLTAVKAALDALDVAVKALQP